VRRVSIGRGRGRAVREGGNTGRAAAGGDGHRVPPGRKFFRVAIGSTLVATLALVYFPSEETAAAPATLVVNSGADAVDLSPGNGQCATAAGTCTLRAAIQEANAVNDHNTIEVSASTYVLSLIGAGEDAAATGDLDITAPLSLVGAGAGKTVVDGNGSDRAFHVLAPIDTEQSPGNVSLSGLTVRGGVTEEDGGGIYSVSDGRLTLDAVTVTGNVSMSDGGGVHTATGTLHVRNGSVVSNNEARNGGGIFNAGELNTGGIPSLTVVTGSRIAGNRALGGGGGVWVDHEGALTLTDVDVNDNVADDAGGGVSVASKASLTINNGAFSGNRAHGDGGALSTATERSVSLTGTTFTDNRAGVPLAGEPGDGSGGAMASGGSGVVEVDDATFTGNSASGEGGAIHLDNNGSVAITNSLVAQNEAGAGGGGVENAASRVTLSRLMIRGNRAALEGGGVESQGSGAFTIIDSTIRNNTAANGGGFTNAADGSTRVERTLIWDNRAVGGGGTEESGLGGGIYSLGDADASYSNITITGNLALTRGGGFYVDADADVRVTNATIVGNSAPIASGVGGEIASINFPIQPSQSVVFRNSIVAENLLGSNCSFAIGSEGGNIQGDTSCHFIGFKDRTAANPRLDAVADNGGPTMTMAVQPDSLALDGGVNPCPPTDQRGVTRPQNELCDSGAYESEGPFPAPDDEAPDTEYLTGPIQDTENTSAFTFTGSDNVTPANHLVFECRLIETEVGEPPEPPDPTEPPDPEFAWLGCQSPWQVELQEEGFFTFEVRAIDRAGNVDETPAVHTYGGVADVTPPQTELLDTPPDPSFSDAAAFTVSGTDDQTPAQFLEYECRIDTLDPEAWLECTNPVVFTNLSVGTHTVQARATDGADNVDPSPASYTWTVAPPADCDQANTTVVANADVYVDQGLPLENFVVETELAVRSGDAGTNARTLVEFPLSTDLPDCTLESAILRLFAGSGEPGRTLEAISIADSWTENTATWVNQPGTVGAPVTTTSGEGYREWDVTSHVNAVIAGERPSNGWLIRDAAEGDVLGAEQSFLSRETPQSPPETTLPQLVLRFEAGDTPPPPPPPSGEPVTLSCGDTVTESIVLQNDLVNCLGEGLIVGAPDIEIDLNGHTISGGLILEPGEEEGLFAGIRNTTHENVVIKNGTIRNFGYGVRLMAGARFNVVEDMTFDGNVIAGVELFDADDGRNGNTIRDSRFRHNGDGVALTAGTEGAVISGNTFDGNLGRAVYVFDSQRNRIADNTMIGLLNDPLLDSDGGVFLEGSPDNVVIGNTITDVGDAGIVVDAGSHRVRIEGNTMSRTSDAGIEVSDSDKPEVTDNEVHLAGGAAVRLSNSHDGVIRGNDLRFNPGGIELAGSNGNLVENNDVRMSLGDGIVVEGGLQNVIRANDASQTDGTGIVIPADAVDVDGNPIPGNVVEGNTTNNNLGNGIQVSAGGHEVTDNAAHNNAAWGITADEFVVDGGGNTASGNGEPEQCSGIVCGPGTSVPPAEPDLTAPDTQLVTRPADGSSMFDPQTFTFTGTDNTAPETALRFECRLDAPPDPPSEPPEPGEPPEPPESETWHECGSPWTYDLLASGEHTFEVRAIDPFDNIDLTPASFTWNVVAAPPGPDSTSPSTTIVDAPADPSTSTTARFGFGGSDNSTPGPSLTFECSLDGAAFEACESPAEYTDLSLGEHTFEVRTVDLQGNADPTPATHTWTIVEPDPDDTAPDTTIESGPDRTTVSTEASFTFSSDEEGVTFECSLDGAAFEACEAPAVYTGLVVDDHTFEVRAVDAAGNEDPTPATFDWTVGLPPVDTAVSCGEVVTQSIRLTNDLLDCPAGGLVIGAPGITVDLAGHTIDGAGIGSGVLNSGFDSVTITNGIVQEFDAGVALGNGTAWGVVSQMTTRLNAVAGIQLTNADDGTNGNVVRDNTVSGNSSEGVLLLTGTQHTHLLRNTIAGNSGIGVHVLNSSFNVVEANDLSGMGGAGVVLEGAVDNRVVDNNVMTSSDAAVIVHLGSHRNRVEGNELRESEAGINVLQSDRNELVGNEAYNMSDYGIVLEEANDGLVKGNDVRFNAGGIEMDLSTGNRIEENNASETAGVGIEVADGSVRNVLVRNTANANEAGGIAVETVAAPGAGNLLDRNITSDNTGDGIYVGDVGHLIVGNAAHNNAEWGIYAADPTVAGMNIDGGGNTASGNTGGEVDPITLLPLQCKNIVCDGGPPQAVDRVAPTTAISAAPLSPTTQKSATFRFTGSDNATSITFECRLDSSDAADFEPCTSPLSYTGLEVGEHTFEVRAVDFSGNVDQTPATHTWTIESPAVGVPPNTTIDSGPDAATADTSASFSFSADEPDVTFECALDGGAFGPCTSPQSYSPLSQGQHTLAVQAIDDEGNVDPTPATYTWTIVAPPVAASVSCGQLITTSIRVTNDLTDCQGNGLVIGSAGIVLDLDGHTIDGTGSGAGILNTGRDNVVIMNGVIQEFDFGVQLGEGTAGNTVSGLTLQLNQEAGVQLLGADDGTTGNTVRDNNLIDNNYGVWLSDGTQFAVVRGNTVTSSSLDGIRVENSNGNRIDGNSVDQSSGAGVALVGASNNTVVDNTLMTSSEAGISVGEPGFPANDNRVEGNTIRSSSSAGISVVESNGNELIGNTATLGGSVGIELDRSNNTLVRANDVSGNASGIELVESSDNRIEGNNASGSNGTGISLESGSVRNQIVLNNATGNSGEGIYVNVSTDPANGNLIDGNIANNNGGDGIIVNGSGNTVSDNTVHSNDGWGILANSGTIDGGGNEAAGNAEPAQCSGVVCTIGTAPGAPDTEIVDKPEDPSDSANALFTFIGTDDTTPLFDLSFECRLDSDDPAAWSECENPQEYFDLEPGEHTFEVRAVDLGELVDPTPATYTWTYNPLPTGVAPDTFIDIAPPQSSPLLDVLFTFSSNEPDVTFECSLDDDPYTSCAFGFEHEFDETEVGEHTFRVRATDAEGNTDQTPATYTWMITGLTTTITAGPAFIPPSGPGEPAEGGETTSTTAVFEFEANVADATFLCSIDLGPFEPCTSPAEYSDLAAGEHIFQVIATDPESEATQLESTEYEWTVLLSEDVEPPNTSITSAPATGTSDTVFEFTGSDNQTQPEALTFECRLDSTDEGAWVDCVSPFNLLEEFPDLAPGDHVFEVRANDNAEPADPNSPFEGNLDPSPAVHEWTSVADTTAPVATLLTTPETPTIEPDVEFAFAGSDNATPELLLAFECSVDGGPFETCESPESVQGLEPGEHTFAVRAVDMAGNPGEPATFTWELVGPPTTTIESGPADPSDSRDATFEFSSDQPDVTFECAVDGGDWLPCTSPASYSGLTDGEHTFEVRGTNSLGLTEDAPPSYAWTVAAPLDTTAPDTSITASPFAVMLSGDAVFEFASSEVGSTFECSLDGADFTGCSSPLELSSLADGQHTFRVRATDAAGNADSSPATYDWMVDLSPVAEIELAPTQVSETNDATFEFSANEFVEGFECFLDGVVDPCTSPVTYTDLALGTHVFGVRAVDDTASDPSEFTDHEWEIVAAAPPTTSITGGPSGNTTATTATITFTGTDNATQPGQLVFECSLDGGPFEVCTSPLELIDVALGDHRLEIRAIDGSGTPDPTPAVVTWTVSEPDTAAPQTTISSGPAETTTSAAATLVFGADEAGSTFECSLDGEPFGSCESPIELTGLELGEHTFAVRATDLAGNTDATPAEHTWTVVGDTTGPDTTITGGPAGSNTALNVSFEFTGTDDTTPAADLEFECSFDGGPFESCSSPEEIPDVAEGEHTFEVRAVDAALNVDPTPATRTWTRIDTTAPETTIDTAPETPSDSTTATFAFSSDEVGVSFECSLDGAPFSTCTSPMEVTGLAVGDHHFRVRAIDPSDNADETPERYDWTVVSPDPPATTIASGPPASTTETEASFSFTSDQPGVTFECDLDGAGFVECESPYELANLTVGAHELRVRAVDAADKVDPSPETYTWTVTAPVPPQTTIVLAPPASTEQTSATFTFSSNDAAAEFECSLNGVPYTGCESPVQLTNLALGDHTFNVRAVDVNGLADPTPASRTWRVVEPAPPPVQCNPSTATYNSNADAWINQGSPSENKGDDSNLKVMSKSGSNLRALVQFALPAQIPQGCVVQSATLRLYAGSYRTGRTLQALQVNAAWAETNVTWSNQPATTGPAATTTSGSGWRQWNVTSQVQSMFVTANRGFLIRDAVENQDHEQQFHSREKAPDRPPQLVVTYGPG